MKQLLVALCFLISNSWAFAQDLGSYVYLLGKKQDNGNFHVPYKIGIPPTGNPTTVKAFPIYGQDNPDYSTAVGTATVVSIANEICELKLTYAADELLFQFPNPQKKVPFSSIHLVVAGLGVTIGDEEKAPFYALEEAYTFTEYDEYVILEQMRKHVAYVAKEMRGSMDEIDLKGGIFNGKKLFDVMEASTVKNIHQFLAYVSVKPEKYRGNTWMLAEIYATWLTSETPLPDLLVSYYQGNIGLRLADGELGYPHVSELLSRIYFDGSIPELGDLLISINGTSMYGKSAQEAMRSFTAEMGLVCEIKLLKQYGAFEDYSLPRMRISDTDPANWKKLTARPGDVELLAVTRGQEWGFINRNGEEVVPLKFKKVNEFSNGLAAFEKDGLWGFLNYEGKEVIAPKWKKVYSFREGAAAVFKNANSLTFGGTPEFIDRTGKVIIPEKHETDLMCYGFSEGRYNVSVGGKIGCIDKTGLLVVPAKFYSIDAFRDGVAWAVQEEKGMHGLIDKQGNWLLPPAYSSTNPFENGLALVIKEGVSMLINKKGEPTKKFSVQILSAGFLGIPPFYEGRARIKQQDLVGFADEQGKVVVPARFKDTSWRFSEGYIGVSEDKANWYFIDKNGNKPIPGTFEAVSNFSDGVCWVKKGEKWALIDAKGKELIKPIVSSLPGYFVQGTGLVNLGNFLNEKYVLVNKEGKILWE